MNNQILYDHNRITYVLIMDELDDLATYNGDTEHDMWVDFTTHEYTGELGDIFDDSDVDNFEDNLNDD